MFGTLHTASVAAQKEGNCVKTQSAFDHQFAAVSLIKNNKTPQDICIILQTDSFTVAHLPPLIKLDSVPVRVVTGLWCFLHFKEVTEVPCSWHHLSPLCRNAADGFFSFYGEQCWFPLTLKAQVGSETETCSVGRKKLVHTEGWKGWGGTLQHSKFQFKKAELQHLLKGADYCWVLRLFFKPIA